MKTKQKLLVLFILVFPSAFYVYLTAGKERSFVRLPYYGPKHPIVITEDRKTKKDTVFYSVPAYKFSNQNGNKFNSIFLQKRIWVCCFQHLHDTKISPSMAVLMDRVESRTDLDTTLRLITFALDSESANSLATYSQMVHAGKRQLFLSKDSLVMNDFALNAFYSPVDSSYKNGFIHFFLIDREGCIRGIYNGLHVKETDKLIDDISILEAAYYVKENHDKSKKGQEDDDAM